MRGSIERVRAIINGEMPDRAPLYDLLRNDAVIEHFTGQTLTVENGTELVYKAFEPAVDATRPSMKSPNEEKTVTLEDGREQRYYRWTIWNERRHYPDSAAYASAKRAEIESFDGSWGEDEQQGLSERIETIAEDRRKLGEVYLFPGIPGPGLTGLFNEVGLEDFAYYLADCPDVIDGLLEINAVRAVRWAEHLPNNHGVEAGFLGDDIAFHSGPLFSPKWSDVHYLPRLARIIDAYHKRGIAVLFHSDGNLNPILDALVESGIDGLNPIETLAGMDVGEIHRRHPHLFLAGAIDVSQLLPFGRPEEIKEVVRNTIDAAEGRIMIGSSTELNNEVPLENYLALREAVFENPYD